jgi:predicted RNA binding protein YcfA (HicA-like mRNA interferase family)
MPRPLDADELIFRARRGEPITGRCSTTTGTDPILRTARPRADQVATAAKLAPVAALSEAPEARLMNPPRQCWAGGHLVTGSAHDFVPAKRLVMSSAAGPTVTDAMPKKYKEVRAALIDAGWAVVRQRGSHEVWAHPDHDTRIVVAGKDSDTVPAGSLGSIRRASGLEQLR